MRKRYKRLCIPSFFERRSAMSTNENPHTVTSAQDSVPQTKEEQAVTAKKGPYSKLTSFIFAKLLLGEQFVASFKHINGIEHHADTDEKEQRKHERRTHKTPNRILYKVPARTLGFFLTSFGFVLLLLCFFGSHLLNIAPFPLSAVVSATTAISLKPAIATASSPFTGL